MATKNLIPTPIVDKNGKQTTVHKAPELTAYQRASMPAPKVITGEEVPEVEEYQDRLERIRIANQRWDDGGGPSEAERALVAVKALSVVGNLMLTAVGDDGSGNGREMAEEVGLSIQSIGDSGHYETLIVAEAFSHVYCTFRNLESHDYQWGDHLEFSFEGEDTIDWHSEFTNGKDITDLIDLCFTMRELGLMAYDEVPDHGEPRFFAHVYMAATKTINYRQDDDQTLGFIKLVDEFPERGEVIADSIKNGLHLEGVRALIKGEINPALADGVL